MPTSGGEPITIASGSDLDGFAWLPDSSGVVYSSSEGSTVLYPPAFSLRTVARDGSGDRQLTFAEDSYSEPDVMASGAVVSTRTRIRSDIWRFPVGGSPAENTRAARPRDSADRTRADAVREPRWHGGRLPVGQWRPRQPMGGENRRIRHAPDHVLPRSSSVHRCSDVVLRGRADSVHQPSGREHRAMAGQFRRQRAPGDRSDRRWRQLVGRRPMAVLHRGSRRRSMRRKDAAQWRRSVVGAV